MIGNSEGGTHRLRITPTLAASVCSQIRCTTCRPWASSNSTWPCAVTSEVMLDPLHPIMSPRTYAGT